MDKAKLLGHLFAGTISECELDKSATLRELVREVRAAETEEENEEQFQLYMSLQPAVDGFVIVSADES